MAQRKTALVTGAGRRIGRAIAEDLAAHGFAVALHANRSLTSAEETAAAIRAAGGTARAFAADLADADAATGLAGAVVAALGPFDLLVNNASLFEFDSAGAFDPVLFDRHMAVHVKAPALIAAAMARALPADADGLIVNIADQRVRRLTPAFFSYTLSKAAMWTATQTMAMAYAPRIRVNAIGPGPTLPSPRQAQADFDAQVAAIPLKRGPTLAEIGETIRYLYAARSVTGQLIALDGGQHLAWQTPDTANIRE